MSSHGMPYGLQAMLKDGHKHLTGVEEAVVKNIEACKALSSVTKTSLGPNGMNKMVVNHLGKLFVTSDASTIVQEMEVIHPAAKLIVLAAKAMEEEIGDGTNLVVSFAGELLLKAEGLLRDGLHPGEIADGYEKALTKIHEFLDTAVIPGSEKLDVMDLEVMGTRLKSTIASKQYGYEDVLAPLVAKACIDVCPKNPHNFNVDNVRIAKIIGAGLTSSTVMQGIVIRRDTEGSIKSAADAKVAVFSQGLDFAQTETKGTVLLKSAEELEGYAKTEEARADKLIKGIADVGAKVVIVSGQISELASHYCERYGLMLVKIMSKFELGRICRATGATAHGKADPPSADELGYAKSFKVTEIGGTLCIVLQQAPHMGNVTTIVLRGATEQMMDDVERAIDDGVNSYKGLCRDSRAVHAGGATEVQLSKMLAAHGRKETGLEQYAMAKFAEALEVVPRTLAENAGLDATGVVSALHAAHAAAGPEAGGVNIEADGLADSLKDLSSAGITDLYATKWWALKLAVNAAVTVLRVDQIIMSKQAGGPKQGPGDDD